MRTKWEDRTGREKFGLITNGFLLAGMILCTVLRFVLNWHRGMDLCWALFILHYFVNAFSWWKTRHEEASKSLFLGCFLLLMYSPLLLMFLLW